VPSATSCTAVGGWYKGAGGGTLIEVWNGAAWYVQPSPNPKGSTGAFLVGVTCTNPLACTAVGDYSKGSNSPQLTLAERWEGKTWTIQPTPNPKGSRANALYGVSCVGFGSCTAVGTGNGTLAEAWDGTSWTIQPTPNPPDWLGLIQLDDIACTRSTACTTVGLFISFSGGPFSIAETWDGSTWSIQPTAKLRGASGLEGIACLGPHACTTVGFRGGSKTLAERE
jgi:hypothetical protein